MRQKAAGRGRKRQMSNAKETGKMGKLKKQKKKGSQSDPFMDKMNAGLNKLIVLFYFAGAAAYLVSELIKAKNKNKI